jgi:hypothetical protein
VNTAHLPRVLLAVVCATASAPALAQRVQLPSMLPSVDPVSSPVMSAPAPIATFEGGIQAPAADWDPYALPGSTPAPSLLPEDPYLQSESPLTVGGTFTTMRRFLDEVRMDYVWMPGTTANEFGINDLDLSATFAIPFLYNTETPLLVTPGFAFHWWNGPLAPGPDMPSRAFDAYLQGAWNPQITEWFGGEVAFRVGIYSDFKKVTADSIRMPSSGLAVLSFSPSFQVKAGVMYLDRHPVQILPAGGVVWTPNSDIRFEILFPNPKVSRRLTTIGTTEWWGYIRGEYGGGAWTIGAVGDPDLIGYNDLRFAVGLDFTRLNNLKGLFETGICFERQIRSRSLSPEVFYINTTVFVRGGLAY